VLPGRSRVRAFPQACLAGSEVKNVSIVRVYGEALTIAPAAFVSAKLERHIRALESSSTIA
jgi:hypothetical protein